MATYTPKTMLNPTAVNQDSGRLDEMIRLVQGLIEQRRSGRESKFRQQQMQRTEAGWQEEDAMRQTLSRQDQNYRMLAGGGQEFTSQQLNQLILNNELSQEQGKALLPMSSDYVSPEQRLQAFADGLGSIDIYNPAQLNRLFNDTGADRNEAHRLLTQYEQGKTRNTRTGSGGGAGAGDGGGGRNAGPDVQVKVADASRLQRVYQNSGIPAPTITVTPQNANDVVQSLNSIDRAANALNEPRSKVGGVLQNYGTIRLTTDGRVDISGIRGYDGYSVRMNRDGKVEVYKNDRKVNDDKATQLSNMLVGATYSDLIELKNARTNYYNVLRAEASRLNALESDDELLRQERGQ